MPKPQRKVSHFRRIIETKSVSLNGVNPKNLITFVYNNTDSFDRTPMVFVTAKVRGKYIEGFNINYLKISIKNMIFLLKNIFFFILFFLFYKKNTFMKYIIEE